MKNKDEIWIIGTEPPCPRCHHLNKMVHGLVSELGLKVRVRHLAYTDEESIELAQKEGLEPGTAKDVARKGPIDMDWQRVQRLLDPNAQKPAENNGDDCCPAVAEWTPELDEVLRPCEDEALKLGFMMTPVLVFSGRIQHQGSVPPAKEVRNWLLEAYPKSAKEKADQITVEVFGPGCSNCEKVYQNTFEAAARAGFDQRTRIVKVTDIQEFAKHGINITPELGINGKIVSKGKVVGVEEIINFLTETDTGNN